jgi:hypothetical protein
LGRVSHRFDSALVLIWLCLGVKLILSWCQSGSVLMLIWLWLCLGVYLAVTPPWGLFGSVLVPVWLCLGANLVMLILPCLGAKLALP